MFKLKIKDNFLFFAESTRENKIALILNNIGAYTELSKRQTTRATQVNDFLQKELRTRYPEILIIDYLFWSSDKSNTYTKLKSGVYADSVHPNKKGYKEFSKYVFPETTSFLKKRKLPPKT